MTILLFIWCRKYEERATAIQHTKNNKYELNFVIVFKSKINAILKITQWWIMKQEYEYLQTIVHVFCIIPNFKNLEI